MEEEDKDMFAGHVSETFPSGYVVSKQISVGLDETYVLFLSRSSDQATLASALSNGSVDLFDAAAMVKKGSLKAALGDDVPSGLRFSPTDANVVYTCSPQGGVKLWDVRDLKSKKPQTTFNDTSVQEKNSPVKPLISFDVNCSDRLVCAGSEKVRKDTFLLFWDVRTTQLMGGYWDSHDDDVVAVRFHPQKESRLATSGTDGVINVFDVAQTDEDDALEMSANTESSVQKLYWQGDDGLACVTHTEEVMVWPLSEAGPNVTFSREDVCVGLRRNRTDTTYVTDCHFSPSGEMLVLAGSWSGAEPCLRLLQARKKRLRPLAHLEAKLSSKMTRCSILDAETETLYTGGEDGMIKLWECKGQSAAGELAKSTEGKMKQKKINKADPY